MHARTLVSECYSQLASISYEAHHSRARECHGEGNHQRAFRSFPQHKLREKCMQAEVCYHMRRGGRKSTKPKSSTSSRFGARRPSAQRVLEAVRSRFERPFAALDRRSRSWTHRRPFASLVYVCVRWGGNPSPVVNHYLPDSAVTPQRYAVARPYSIPSATVYVYRKQTRSSEHGLPRASDFRFASVLITRTYSTCNRLKNNRYDVY